MNLIADHADCVHGLQQEYRRRRLIDITVNCYKGVKYVKSSCEQKWTSFFFFKPTMDSLCNHTAEISPVARMLDYS